MQASEKENVYRLIYFVKIIIYGSIDVIIGAMELVDCSLVVVVIMVVVIGVVVTLGAVVTAPGLDEPFGIIESRTLQ